MSKSARSFVCWKRDTRGGTMIRTCRQVIAFSEPNTDCILLKSFCASVICDWWTLYFDSEGAFESEEVGTAEVCSGAVERLAVVVDAWVGLSSLLSLGGGGVPDCGGGVLDCGGGVCDRDRDRGNFFFVYIIGGFSARRFSSGELGIGTPRIENIVFNKLCSANSNEILFRFSDGSL